MRYQVLGRNRFDKEHTILQFKVLTTILNHFPFQLLDHFILNHFHTAELVFQKLSFKWAILVVSNSLAKLIKINTFYTSKKVVLGRNSSPKSQLR